MLLKKEGSLAGEGPDQPGDILKDEGKITWAEPQGKGILGRGHSKRKGPEVGTNLGYQREREEAVWLEKWRRREIKAGLPDDGRGRLRKWGRPQSSSYVAGEEQWGAMDGV